MKKFALFFLLIACPALGQQITQFQPANTPLSGTEQLYVVQNGQSRSVTVGNLPGAQGSPPGGANGDIQFNSGGMFGGDSSFTFNSGTKLVGLSSLLVGAATGGGQGAGTVNATGYYLNGSAFTGLTPPASGDIFVANGTQSPAGLAPSGTGCVQTVSSGPFEIAPCGGSADIIVSDSNGNSFNNTSTIQFGPAILLAQPVSGTALVNLNQPDRTATNCSSTAPSGAPQCTLSALDLGGQLNMNVSGGGTVTIPAITSVTPTATATTTSVTLSSGTGVSVGDLIVDASGYYPAGTILINGSGTSWHTNNAPAHALSGTSVTISYLGSGQTATICNYGASAATVSSAPAINGYGITTIPAVNGTGLASCIGLTSNGSTLDGVGLGYLYGQASVLQSNSWNCTGCEQTWGAGINPPNIQSGTTYTVCTALGGSCTNYDCGQTIQTTSSSAVTITLPAAGAVNCSVTVMQVGTGQVTFAANTGAGASLSSLPHSYTKTFGQKAVVVLTIDQNVGGSAAEWVLSGDGAS